MLYKLSCIQILFIHFLPTIHLDCVSKLYLENIMLTSKINFALLRDNGQLKIIYLLLIPSLIKFCRTFFKK